MGIPLSFFLTVYLVLCGLAVIYALFNLYHMFRFGHFDRLSYFATGIFLAGFLFILFASSTFLLQVNWSDSLSVFSGSGSFQSPASFNDFSL